MVIPFLSSRILPVANEKHAIRSVQVAPFNAHNLILSHCGRDREANDATNWNLLSLVRLKRTDDAIQFVLRWASISFIALPNKAKSRESNSSEIDGFDGRRNSMHCRCVC